LITCSGRQQDGLYDRLFAGSCYANGDHWAIVLYYRTSGRVATQMRRAHVTSRSRPSCSTWTRPALRKRPIGAHVAGPALWLDQCASRRVL